VPPAPDGAGRGRRGRAGGDARGDAFATGLLVNGLGLQVPVVMAKCVAHVTLSALVTRRKDVHGSRVVEPIRPRPFTFRRVIGGAALQRRFIATGDLVGSRPRCM
jgi:hypothetical protein